MKKALNVTAVFVFSLLIYLLVQQKSPNVIYEMKTGGDYIANFILTEDMSTGRGVKASKILDSYISSQDKSEHCMGHMEIKNKFPKFLIENTEKQKESLDVAFNDFIKNSCEK
ncbi:hypothetical protein WCT81_04905 [Pectobacterium versatile]|uniref:hypothetical protein n=1 Tax=Pectobacterium versatile TaxID=2488639 RepID=UPI00301B56A0